MILKRFHRTSLYNRITVAISLLLIIAYFSSFFITQNMYVHFVEKQYDDHIHMIARNIASVTYNPLLNHNEMEIFQIGKMYLLENEIDFIMILDRNLNLLLNETNFSVQGDQIYEYVLEEIRHNFNKKQFLLVDKFFHRVIVHPIKMEDYEIPWGYIAIGFNMDKITQIKKTAQFTSLLISVFLLFLGLLVIQKFGHKITEPIQDLMKGTDQVIEGNFDYQIQVEDEGDLGQLARKFNEMVLKLNYYYKQKSLLNKKLNEYNEKLEETIKERTSQLKRIQQDVISIFHQIPVGLLVLDMNKEIMWCNHELLKIIELSDKDTISGESIDSVSKIQDIGLHEVLNKLFEKSAKQIVQHQLKSTKSHDPKLIEIASQPLIRDDSVIDGMIFIIKDVTREVILERKMIQDQRLENVGKIAGGIAHDFNNILAIILPNAQLLKLKLHDKPDWIKFLDTIEKAADQGASLTRKILSFSRGSGTENFEILNLNNIISDFTKMFRRVLDRKIDIVEDFEQNIWNIKADKAQIEQILMNLSVNARDSMKRGGKLFFKSMNLLVSSDVNAEFHPKLKPGKYVSLEVNDTGCGIPPKYMDRIFDPFFSGKKDGQGTGLGLSIVYGIIKSHHGFIDVRSDVGKGTNIQIYFPVSEEEPDSTEESKLDLALGSGTLLVVDDEEMIQHTLTGMLESLNYSVIVANNGKDAVDIYKSRKSEIDAILMDIQMPVMDGVEAAKKILKFDPDVKIVFMSGYAEPKSFEILKEMGYQIFLKKPYKIGNLSDILNKTLTNEISMN